ncbi:unnamed protein product [Cuscuta campestris]|uniref:Uncharacterized protein n=1 Tax=Cuscuta campestris TaxID=132261 RepID=A0A484MYM3_9ASTE|nr:unnamed protein product [Cuscuta campestris]
MFITIIIQFGSTQPLGFIKTNNFNQIGTSKLRLKKIRQNKIRYNQVPHLEVSTLVKVMTLDNFKFMQWMNHYIESIKTARATLYKIFG